MLRVECAVKGFEMNGPADASWQNRPLSLACLPCGRLSQVKGVRVNAEEVQLLSRCAGFAKRVDLLRGDRTVGARPCRNPGMPMQGPVVQRGGKRPNQSLQQHIMWCEEAIGYRQETFWARCSSCPSR